MPKLNFVKIHNYKSIVDFSCYLGKGVNVFTGPSDSGKSNVIRAFRDFFFNAKGDEVVTAKKDKCSITIDDCTWNKGKGLNQYVTPEGTYENVGRTSPQQLRDHFKIDEIAWDEANSKKLQFIQQHDPKFFLDESYTGSLNAKILGLVSGIQRTYNGNRLVLNDLKDAKSRRDSLEIVCKQTEVELKKYDDLPRRKKIVDAIKKAIDKLQGIETEYDKLDTLVTTIKDSKARITTLEKGLIEPLETNDLFELKKLSTNIERLSSVFHEAKRLDGEIKAISRCTATEIETDDITKLKETHAKIRAIESIVEEASDLVADHKAFTLEVTQYEKQQSELEEELQSLVATLKICPLTNDSFCDGCKEKICQ